MSLNRSFIQMRAHQEHNIYLGQHAAWSPALDKHMPLTKVRSRHQPSPWLADNEELRCMMRERDLARADRDADPCAETRQAYVTKRNAVKSAQCRARSSFFLSSYTHSRKQT